MLRVFCFCLAVLFPFQANAQLCLNANQSRQLVDAQITAVPDIWTIKLASGDKLSSQGHYIPMVRPNGPILSDKLDRTEADSLELMQNELVGRSIKYWKTAKNADRRGRIPALIFLTEEDPLAELLIHSGLSLFDPQIGKTNCARMLQDAENTAQKAKIGLWRDASKQNRLIFTVKPEPLLKVLGHRVTVIGKIKNVGIRENRHYLNFGGKWRDDFTVEIAPKVTQRELGGIEKLSALKDQWVKIRGSLRRKSGPMIVITQEAQLEILD